MKNVMLWAGAWQIGMAIARRMGTGMKIVVGDKKIENVQAAARIMNEVGFDGAPVEMDLSSRESIEWGKRGARLNDIAPGIIVTPLALDEFNGPRGDFYKNMFAKCPAGRPGTADEVANVAELLMSDKGAFISGSTFLVDGGATASYYYGPLRPEAENGR